MPCLKMVLTGTHSCLWQLDKQDSRSLKLPPPTPKVLARKAGWEGALGGGQGSQTLSPLPHNHSKLRFVPLQDRAQHEDDVVGDAVLADEVVLQGGPHFKALGPEGLHHFFMIGDDFGFEPVQIFFF